MRTIPLAALVALLLTVSVPGAVRVQQATAVFEGSVVDARTGQPVAGARVTIAAGISAPPESVPSPPAGTDRVEVRMGESPSPRRTILSVVTDHLGQFGFSDLAPGTYTLASLAEGYIYQVYGQKIAFGIPTPINLTTGSNSGFVVRLNPAASVTGTITNEQRVAAPGIAVYLLRPEFSVDGERRYRVEKEAITADDGRYDLDGIPAGRYYLVAGFAGTPRSSQQQIAQPYDWTYYPGVVDASLAAHVDLQAGARMDLGTLVLDKQEPRYVRGRVIDSRTGKPPQAVSLSLTRPSPFEMAGRPAVESRSAAYDASTGAFEFRNVPRGTHRVDASLPQTNSFANLLAEISRNAADDAFAIVHVAGADVNDVLLTVPGTGALRGKIVLNGGASVAGLKLNTQFFLEATQPLQPVVGRTPINPADGSFEVRAAIGGRYRFVVSPLPENFYISDARLDGVRFSSGLLDISKDAVSDLVITLSPDGGQIDGAIVDEKSQPVPRVQGVLLPDPLPETIGFYGPIYSNADGRFTLRGVAPGNYRVYVWDGVGEQQYFDRELLRRSRAQATPIRIDPRARIAPTVKLIIP